MTVTATTKLSLSLADKGDLVGTWITQWNADNQAVEDLLTTSYAGDPNTNVAGTFLGQACYDSTNKIRYVCTTVDVAADAIWEKQVDLEKLLIAYNGIAVSGNDTTPAVLETKLLTDTLLAQTTQNDAGNETRTIAHTAGARQLMDSRKYMPFKASTTANIILQAGTYLHADGTHMVVPSVLTKQNTGTWVAGDNEGGMDTGAVGNELVYYLHLIHDPTNDLTDLIFSLSLAAPTLPANYTKSRMVGYAKTNGSAQWAEWYVVWDEIGFNTTVLAHTLLDISLTNTLNAIRTVMGDDPAVDSYIAQTAAGGIETDDDITAFAH